MYVKNVTEKDLNAALAKVNQHYDGNIVFKRLEARGKRYLFTLTVDNARSKGGRRSPSMINKDGAYKVVSAACWHVHGDFFDALIEINPNAIIKSLDKEIDIDGGNWLDWNAGSMMQPRLMSDCCECN